MYSALLSCIAYTNHTIKRTDTDRSNELEIQTDRKRDIDRQTGRYVWMDRSNIMLAGIYVQKDKSGRLVGKKRDKIIDVLYPWTSLEIRDTLSEGRRARWKLTR